MKGRDGVNLHAQIYACLASNPELVIPSEHTKLSLLLL